MHDKTQNNTNIWKKTRTIDQLNKQCEQSLVSHLDIEFCGMTETELFAKMPVNEKSKQPFGVLHGGASVTLAESVASMAAWLTLAEDLYPVGIEVKANHVSSVTSGHVIACASPVHLGRQTQVWKVDICDESKVLVCSASMTILIQGGRK